MSNWILQHFLNPTFFWTGMLLVAAPIIIHLIHRLRYRKVRFAAMEFLLASQKQNRSRILIEQLLLLLLRIIIVLIVVGLIARFILDPNQLSLFQGSKSHHVVILDDTVSMQDRGTDATLFEKAKEVVRRIAAEGAKTPGTQILTLSLMSAPEQTLSGLSETDINDELLIELTERLEVLSPTFQAADPAVALEVARERLAEDRSAVRHIHVISDFRETDWIDNKAATSVLQSLSKSDIRLNLVKCAAEEHENLGVTHLGGLIEVAAAGVPVTLEASIKNWGSRDADDVRADLFVNGNRLPRTIDFQKIPSGEEAARSFDVIFPTAESHHVKIKIRNDAFEADNQRFLAIDVPQSNPVLIVDGSPSTEQAFYIADALAADESITGFSITVVSPEELRRTPLSNFDLIYLINIPDLAPDAVVAVEDFVSQGGGLVWYLGDAINPSHYNEKLFKREQGLFPVRLDVAPQITERTISETSTQPDIVPERHPLFSLFMNSEVPILDLVFVNVFYPLAETTDSQQNIALDVKTLATLRGQDPLILEHKLGKGKILTCLTAAGPLMNQEGTLWTNWANGPASFSFAVFQLELAKHLVRSDRTLPQLEAGQEIQLSLNQAFYLPEIEVISPDDQVDRILAVPTSAANEEESTSVLGVQYQETDQPGVYELILTTSEESKERRLYATNVPAKEGSMKLMEDEKLLNELGSEIEIDIQQADNFDWIRNDSPGSEVRWLLLILLAILCIGEQALASRLSYVA